MSTLEHISYHEAREALPWQRYVIDSVLASSGSLLVTAFLFTWHLYPRIPNISIIYLLVVIALASTRGRYAAILASLVAFLSFDFFIVPPLFTFVMYRPEEYVALVVFLVDAILTGQLAAALRQRAQNASRRERETHILYDLVRVVNGEEAPERQLQAIMQAIVDVFSSWGVHDCAMLQPDASGTLRVQASASQPLDTTTLSTDEQDVASWVLQHGRAMSVYDETTPALSPSTRFLQHITLSSTVARGVVRRSLRFIPLTVGQQIIGVMRLQLLDDPRRIKQADHFQEERDHPNAQTAFFWTFLDQATSLVERTRLRRENLSIELLQRTDALRAALLSSVSHDLRTPLASIKAATSSLLQEEVQWDDDARRSFLLSIERQADRLNRLVGNLLDMSRIEDGALRPEKEWYHVAEVIYDVVERMHSLLQGRLLHMDIPDELPPVELDYLLIDQVLTNLLENALRYTPPASPIDIRVQSIQGEVMIGVADRGPGIPVSEYERVFDKFYRVLGTRRYAGNPTDGSGLGLAVCKGIVEAHRGTIWTEAREGGGAIFFVTLPVGAFERNSL